MPLKKATSSVHVGDKGFAGQWHLLETFVRLDEGKLGNGVHYLYLDNELIVHSDSLDFHGGALQLNGINAVYLHANADRAPSSRAQVCCFLINGVF